MCRRKFACFAIGNAGFHNGSLYEALRPAVAPLVALLSDDEEKTRANAAGALGNLVRNNNHLCDEVIQVRADGSVVCVVGLSAEQWQGQLWSAEHCSLWSVRCCTLASLWSAYKLKSVTIAPLYSLVKPRSNAAAYAATQC